MDYHRILDEIAEAFIERPLDFLLEQDLQTRVAEALRQELRNRDTLYADFADVSLTYSSDNMANYKLPYPQQIREKAEEIKNPLSRVHTEVAVQDHLTAADGWREQIDVVVFRNQLENAIEWNDGSNRFDPEDFEAAIELKYIKNKNYFPTHSGIDDLTESLKTDSNSIASDLEELAALPEHTETFLVIFSNYNYLYQGPVLDTSANREQKYTRVGDAMCDWLRANVGDTHVLYAHPFYSEWITDHS
jgi:hypothetical protein